MNLQNFFILIHIALIVNLWTTAPGLGPVKQLIGAPVENMMSKNLFKKWWSFVNWCTKCSAFQLTLITGLFVTRDILTAFVMACTASFIALEFELLYLKLSHRNDR